MSTDPAPAKTTDSRLDRFARLALWLLVAASLGLRFLLALNSPFPAGYSYDPYWRSSEILVETGRLPESKDCWECYQPPVGAIVGAPFWALGLKLFPRKDDAVAMVNLVGLLSGFLIAFFGYRSLCLLGYPRGARVLGAAILLAFPCLFFSSWSSEADIIVAAIVAALMYELLRYQTRPESGAREVLAIGILTGAAMSTKYSGLVACAPVAVAVALRFLAGPRRGRVLVQAVAIAALTVTFGSWKYIDNYRKYSNPFFEGQSTSRAGGGEHEGLLTDLKGLYWNLYDFKSFRPREALDLFRLDGPKGWIINQPIYYSVWTTLHSMGWSDMSFFTRPGREYQDWPVRRMPIPLVGAVLALGILPTLLAILGLIASLRRQVLWPTVVLSGAGFGAYIFWVLAQLRWALKTKYVIFLLPAYVIFVLEGLSVVRRFAPRFVTRAVGLGLGALILVVHVYLWQFAVGTVPSTWSVAQDIIDPGTETGVMSTAYHERSDWHVWWEGFELTSTSRLVAQEVSRLTSVSLDRLDLADGEVFLEKRLSGPQAPFYRARIGRKAPGSVSVVRPRFLKRMGPPLVVIRRPWEVHEAAVAVELTPSGPGSRRFQGVLPEPFQAGDTLTLGMKATREDLSRRPIGVALGAERWPMALVSSPLPGVSRYLSPRFVLRAARSTLILEPPGPPPPGPITLWVQRLREPGWADRHRYRGPVAVLEAVDTNGDPRWVVDGQTPPDGTIWDSPECLLFDGTGASVTLQVPAIDLDGVQVSADHNDIYDLECRREGGDFVPLGQIDYAPFAGTATRSFFSPELKSCRALRLRPACGDDHYSVCEISFIASSPAP